MYAGARPLSFAQWKQELNDWGLAPVNMKKRSGL